LAGAFLAAEMQFGRLPPPAVLGSVQNQQERSQTQQLIDGLTASIVGASKRQKTDPEGARRRRRQRRRRQHWAVVTGYGVGSYKEAVNKWRDSGADITSDTCFWKAHGRECMNNSCPACKHGSQ
jgi:hypothetical protein